MASQKPRILAANLLYDHPPLRASTSETANPVDNLRDLIAGRYWKPTRTSNPPPTEYVYVYPLNGQLLPVNWYFQLWTDGPSSAPDGWGLIGSGAAVARESSSGIKVGQYSAKLTRSGADCYLTQSVADGEALRDYQVTVGAWVTCSVASRAYVAVWDGSTETLSSAHTGGGTAEFLTATAVIPHDASQVAIRLIVKTGDTLAYFDGAGITKGASLAQTPHAIEVDTLAIFDHNLAEGAGQVVSLEWSEDNFATSTELVSITPSDRRAYMATAGSSVTKAYYRVPVTPAGTGSIRAAIAVVYVGLAYQFPDWIEPGFAPHDRILRSRMAQSENSEWQGSDLVNEPLPLTIEIPWLDESDITDATFQASLDWIYRDLNGDGGRPFFLGWDLGDHSDQVFYCRVPNNARGRMPLAEGNLISSVRIEALGRQA